MSCANNKGLREGLLRRATRLIGFGMGFGLAFVSTAHAAAGGAVQAVKSVDLERYAGTWYEIARLPNKFQNLCAGDVTATYRLLGGGRIAVVNRCRKADGEWAVAEGEAKLAGDSESGSKLKVRFAPAFLSFLPFVWADYWVIDLAPDYSYAVVAVPNRKYLWVLSRTPTMEPSVYRQILERAASQGFEVDRLESTSHSEEVR